MCSIHEAGSRSGEKDGGLANVVRRTEAAERCRALDVLLCTGRLMNPVRHWRVDESRQDSVDTNPGIYEGLLLSPAHRERSHRAFGHPVVGKLSATLNRGRGLDVDDAASSIVAHEV